MENLTHTLTGLMLARAGFNRWCPRAAAILMVAANIPDADVVVRLVSDSLGYLDVHRGITHSLIAAPVMGALAVGIVAAVTRKRLPWLRAVVMATIGVVSHLLLDWTNTYGIRMLLPFSEEWQRLDITNVVDLWIWVILLLAVAGPWLSKLVSAEIGAKPGTGQGGAIFALVMILSYEGARYTIHERAVNTLNAHMYEGSAARRVAAFPHFANPFQWVGYVETSNAVIVKRMNLVLPYDPTGGSVYYPPEHSKAMEVARQSATVQRFLNFAQFPFWQVIPQEKPDGSVRVEVMDLRFGDPGAPRFVATVVLDAGLRIVEEQFAFGPMRPR